MVVRFSLKISNLSNQEGVLNFPAFENDRCQ